MDIHERLEQLLEACEQRLALIEGARADALERSRHGRYPNLPYFYDRERAVYTFGITLLMELREPGGPACRLFP